MLAYSLANVVQAAASFKGHVSMYIKIQAED